MPTFFTAMLVIGVLGGVLTALLTPRAGPTGSAGVVLQAVLGSLVGGLWGHTLFGTSLAANALQVPALIGSSLGALAVLLIHLATSRRTPQPHVTGLR